MKLHCTALSLGFLFACANVAAAPVVGCDDINAMGEALSDLESALNEGAEIGVGGDVDQSLREIIDGLGTIAEAEDDGDLGSAANAMDAAWHDTDLDAFTNALGDAITRLAVIVVNECQ